MRVTVLHICLALVLTACSGGGSDEVVARERDTVNNPASNAGCDQQCSLSPTDVETIIAQAVAEAGARQESATVAVVDRVGNVLGVFAMDGADPFVTITSTAELGAPVTGGLEDLNFIPAQLAAIAKAITGAYLSTTQNAFTTRTASQIVQEHFNPGERDVPSGPLFGVQFSQLPCGDFVNRSDGTGPASAGPHRSPLGLSADPGGLPLYIDGEVVGGVGVIADGVYGLDKIVTDFDQDPDELIALAGAAGYAAPVDIRGTRITVLGKTFRFTDASVVDLLTTPEDARPLGDIIGAGAGEYQPVPGYFDGTGARAGTTFGTPASGIRPADPDIFSDTAGDPLDAFVFVDGANRNRFPARDGTDMPGGDVANRLTAGEVQVLLNEAIGVANESRAQIRVPVGTPARVTVAVVDSDGTILGMGRSRDGPVFGADVSLQKARTAALFSGTGRSDESPAGLLRSLPPPLYLAPLPEPPQLSALATLSTPTPTISGYVDAVQIFLADAGALESAGSPVAISDRAGGNLSRPNFPDGPAAGPPGPFSKPDGEWSIFSTGLQLDLVYNAVIQHVAFTLGAAPDVGSNCTGNRGFTPTDTFDDSAAIANLPNGIQIFPGSVPIYRGDVLVGGIGVSGDGVDQDDLISILGVHRAGQRLGTGVGNAPPEIRADRLDIPGQQARLRYVSCPQVPFIDDDRTEVCDGL